MVCVVVFKAVRCVYVLQIADDQATSERPTERRDRREPLRVVCVSIGSIQGQCMHRCCAVGIGTFWHAAREELIAEEDV